MTKFKNIILATDFSDTAKTAYKYAQGMAAHLGANIQVVHFFDKPSSAFNSDDKNLTFSLDDMERDAQKRFDELIDEPEQGPTNGGGQSKPTFKSYNGLAADGLIALSKDPSVDLMILGTKGTTNWADTFYGSTAVSVSSGAFCPVLLVPHGTDYRAFQNIVYTSAFDSAEPTEIRFALDFAYYFESVLHFVHVITDADGSGVTAKILFKTIIEDENRLTRYTIDNVRADTPLEGIQSYFLNNPVDLLVTVTRHHSFWSKLMVQSTTTSLAWDVRLPLLVLYHDNASH